MVVGRVLKYMLEKFSICCMIMANRGIEIMNSNKIKKMCNYVILVLTICSVLMLLRFSDLPNFFNISFMDKPDVISDIQLSIFTSFVVTAVFYFVMNFIPDKIKEMESEEFSLPYRRNVQRDVQLFGVRVLSMWGSVLKTAAAKNSDIDISKISTILEMFDGDLILSAANEISLNSESDVVDAKMNKLLWKYKIKGDLKDITQRGQRILDKYAKDIPPSVYDDIYYLLDASELVGTMERIFSIGIDLGGNAPVLGNYIAKNLSDNQDISKTAKSINDICKWVNEEYDWLMERVKPEQKGEIHYISLSNFLK